MLISRHCHRFNATNQQLIKTELAILLGVGTLVAVGLYRKSAALGSLSFYPANVKDLEFDGVTPVFTFGLAVQNTSNQNFTLQALAGNVFANNYFVGNVSDFTPVTIAAAGETVVNLKVRMSLIGIVNDIVAAFQNNNTTQELELESNANIDGIQVPVNIKYKVGL